MTPLLPTLRKVLTTTIHHLNSPPISTLKSRIPARMHRPLALLLLLTLTILLFLPLILAQGPPFTCRPFLEDDYRAAAFGSLSPFCCREGMVDDELKVGRGCVLATKAGVVDGEGARLESCLEGRVMSCCMVIHHPNEITKVPLQYCDQSFLVRPSKEELMPQR